MSRPKISLQVSFIADYLENPAVTDKFFCYISIVQIK